MSRPGKTIDINIETDNAAFDDNEGVEVAAILRQLAERFEYGLTDCNLKDSNGNTVGSCYISEEV